jgi:hypothetical protein
MLNLKLMTPEHILYWWLDNGRDVKGWEEVFEGFLRGPCTFETVDLENWPYIVVGAGVQMARVRVPGWCERVETQMPSVWGSKDVVVEEKDVLRKLVYGIGFVDWQWPLEIRDISERGKEGWWVELRRLNWWGW